eukprot:scaffold316789_cov16-Prasinocladus_malaysianus.AAC.1
MTSEGIAASYLYFKQARDSLALIVARRILLRSWWGWLGLRASREALLKCHLSRRGSRILALAFAALAANKLEAAVTAEAAEGLRVRVLVGAA